MNISIFSLLEKNQIINLLYPQKKGDPKLKVRDSPKGVFIENLKSETVNNYAEAMKCILSAISNSYIQSTRMGSVSSRGQLFITLTLKMETKNDERKLSRLKFVILCDSEKVQRKASIRNGQSAN